MILTLQRLKEVLSYDPETGIFRWKIAISRHRPGAIAGGKHGRYVMIGLDGQYCLAHRLAWFYVTGHWPQKQIDHRNNDGQDNRWRNLREASPAQNSHNSKCHADSASGAKGVCLQKSTGRWMARIMRDGVRVHLGSFDTIAEAAAARRKAAIELHGHFARHD